MRSAIGIARKPLARKNTAAWMDELRGPVELPPKRGYRDEGGPREYLIPDFLVGAHALVQAGQLAAVDRGYLRRYFLKLKVLSPSM